MSKVMNHAEYQNKVRKMDDEALKFVIADCQKVLEAWRDHPNGGYYSDEIHYCSMELRNRSEKLQKKIPTKRKSAQ